MGFHDAATPEDVPTAHTTDQQYLSKQEETEQEIKERVIHLLDAAVVLVELQRGKQMQCQMCGWTDGAHAAGCPVPALETWLGAHV